MADETVFGRAKRIRRAQLTMPQTFLLITLNEFIGLNADAWPSQTTIANAMNATCRSVRNWQTELEEIGVLRVDVGKGRSSTNRYRIDFDSLPLKEEPRSALNEEPRSGFVPDDEINEEPRSGESRNVVPVNEEPRSYRKNKKEHKKEQGVSFPEKLRTPEFSEAWQSWIQFRREIKKKLPPSTIAKQLTKLDAWGSSKAVRSIELSIENGWQGLFNPDQRSGKAIPAASSEAAEAWQAVLESLKRHSRFKPELIMGDVGQRAWGSLKPIGLKKLDESSDFDRRELQKRFVQEFSKQGTTS